jgi:serine protease
MRWFTVLLVLMAGLLSSCDLEELLGGISGTVSLGAGGQSTDERPVAIDQNRPRWVAGEVVVQFKAQSITEGLTQLAVGGTTLERVRPLALAQTYLYRSTASLEETPALAQSLAGRPDVVYAHPNFLLYPSATANDTYYSRLWHYQAINIPQAWDSEKGLSNPVTVAVIDTGILTNHPDFAGKLVGGYDFISDARTARDGNGRDSNPADPGDNLGGNGSYHGSHVAGTIAAATNNSLGIAGVSWGAQILPIRVLGVNGGTLTDIIDGLLWSAGVSVSGIPANSNPAHVINMSLGGEYRCLDAPAYQQAINQVRSRGKIVVVAAGNEDDDASLYSPASCDGVITVGATNHTGSRAWYSNYGSRIDLMGPGGDTSLTYQGYTAGVLSLVYNESQSSYTYAYYQGTSMATPHVAGVIALMKSKKPSLSHDEALDVLSRTARPLSSSACDRPTGSNCGAGLIDAQAALAALNTTSPNFTLSLSPNSGSVAPGGSLSTSITINRSGGFSNSVMLSLSGAPSGVSSSFSPNPASNTSTLSFNVASYTAPGVYTLTLSGTGGSLTRQAVFYLTVGTVNRPTLEGSYLFALYWDGYEYVEDLSQMLTVGSNTTSASYEFPYLLPGQYVVAGWKDTNDNEDVDAGDFFGAYLISGELALITPPRAGVNFTLDLVLTNDAQTKGLNLNEKARQIVPRLLGR